MVPPGTPGRPETRQHDPLETVRELPERQSGTVELGGRTRVDLLFGVGHREGIDAQLHRQADGEGEERRHPTSHAGVPARALSERLSVAVASANSAARNGRLEATTARPRGRPELAVQRARGEAGEHGAKRRQLEQADQQDQVAGEAAGGGDDWQQRERAEREATASTGSAVRRNAWPGVAEGRLARSLTKSKNGWKKGGPIRRCNRADGSRSIHSMSQAAGTA